MRFSIRQLLAVLLLSGLAFPLLMGIHSLRLAEAKLVQVENEIEVAKARAKTIQSFGWERVQDHVLEECAAVHELRSTCIAHFPGLQSKYDKVEPRDASTFSLRSVPQFAPDGDFSALAFRVIVPERRAVWLRYAVVPVSKKFRSSKTLDNVASLNESTGFGETGPLQISLSAGEHLIEYHAGKDARGTVPITLSLDGKTLVDTEFSARGNISASSSSISGREQVDYTAKRQLPVLLRASMDSRPPDGQRVKAMFEVAVWLSDQATDHQPLIVDREETRLTSQTPVSGKGQANE